MRLSKKILGTLLCAMMLCGIFSVIKANAATGPNPGEHSCAYIVGSDDETYNTYIFDGICAEYREFYLSDTKTTIKGVSYDKKTNTLTLDNCNVPHIEVNEMGDDFTIKLIGNNTVTLLVVWGYGYGGSATFTGNGTLNGKAIYLNAEKTKSVFAVKDNAKIILTSKDDFKCFYIDDTYAKDDAIQAKYDKSMTVIENKHPKKEAVTITDGSATSTSYYALMTKGSKTYYEMTCDDYDLDTGTFIKKWDLYDLTDGKENLIKTYASEEALLADGYEYVLAESTYSHICDTQSITFTAGNGTASKNTNSGAKGDTITASDTQYIVTKAGTKKAAGTVAFASPKTGVKKITIPATITVNGIKYKVTSISAEAFSGNKTVTKVTIGKNVKTIGKKAFFNCESLTEIKINTKKLTKSSVKADAFKGVNSKCTVSVPSAKKTAYTTILQKTGLDAKAVIK